MGACSPRGSGARSEGWALPQTTFCTTLPPRYADDRAARSGERGYGPSPAHITSWHKTEPLPTQFPQSHTEMPPPKSPGSVVLTQAGHGGGCPRSSSGLLLPLGLTSCPSRRASPLLCVSLSRRRLASPRSALPQSSPTAPAPCTLTAQQRRWPGASLTSALTSRELSNDVNLSSIGTACPGPSGQDHSGLRGRPHGHTALPSAL